MNFFIFFCSQKVTMLAPEFFANSSIHYTWIRTPGGTRIIRLASKYTRSMYPGIRHGEKCENLRREHGHFL